eukprot:scaffold173748_cov49-Attheya_sp.AAC.1
MSVVVDYNMYWVISSRVRCARTSHGQTRTFFCPCVTKRPIGLIMVKRQPDIGQCPVVVSGGLWVNTA